MSRLIDLAGKKIGKLTVLEIVSKTRGNKHVRWLCECECGNKKEVAATHLNRCKTLSCGCLRRVSGKEHKDWNGCGDISGDVWSSIRHNATIKGREKLEFSITIEFAWDLFLKQDKRCALSGVDLVFGPSKVRTASLDRIDNGKGYTEDNVQWVHKRINMMKGTLAEKYFIELCCAVAKSKGGVCGL